MYQYLQNLQTKNIKIRSLKIQQPTKSVAYNNNKLDKDGNIVLYNDTLSDTDYDYTVENLRDPCGYDACSIADALNYPKDYFNKKALEDHYDEIMRFLNSKSNINKIYDDFDKFINEIQLPFEWTHLTA